MNNKTDQVGTNSNESADTTGQTVRVYVGVGSNINADANIRTALEGLQKQFGEIGVSPSYVNPAQGFVGDDFVNLVVGFWYQGSIRSLKHCLMDIERKCGREREKESGMNSRPMDIDLLTFGGQVGVYEGVTLPRSDVYDREFVWLPLGQLLESLLELSQFESDLLDAIKVKIKA